MIKKKKIIMTLCCDIFPLSAGHHKAMYEIAKYLHGRENVSLTLLIFSQKPLRSPSLYNSICDYANWIPIPPKWSFWDVLNKISIRVLPVIYQNAIWSFAMRKNVRKFLKDADLVVINYPFWFPVVPKYLRASRTIVITHDVVFYRIGSFKGNRTLLQRLRVSYNRFFESRVLDGFKVICVFGEYEIKLLLNCGISKDKLIRLGMPMLCTGEIKKFGIEYDFITIGSNIEQNVMGLKCFFERVVPMLDKNRVFRFAVAGTLSSNDILDGQLVPSNIKVIKLGYVDSLADACSKARIGIGTPPCGSGIKVKVVEMMMNGLPMVLTHSGQEGIPVLPGCAINIDVESDSVAALNLRHWLEDNDLAREAGKRQGEFLRKVFSPENCLSGLRDLLLMVP